MPNKTARNGTTNLSHQGRRIIDQSSLCGLILHVAAYKGFIVTDLSHDFVNLLDQEHNDHVRNIMYTNHVSSY